MKACFFSLVLVMTSVGVFAQTNDPVIMTINGKDFKKSEFEYFYNKYNNEDAIDKRSLNDYVDLFKNLKLKVAEAEAQGMDTTASFRTELAGYRATEAKPYLDSLKINEDMLQKEYNRTKDIVEISHIVIEFSGVKKNDFKTFPSDTLDVYKKATQVRNRLLKGENFEKVAAEVSDDANTAKAERPGYLGWFTGLMLNPPFEEAVFNTQVGAVSQLARTNFGYHIIKVNGKKENPGQINVAHILIQSPPNADSTQVADAQKTVNDVYDQLTKGADFAELAKQYSKDPGSASKGGELGWISYGGPIIKKFQDVAFELKDTGEISKPFQTQFGYHIIKLLGKKPMESFSEKRKEIENKLNSGGYFIPLHQQGIDDMKKELGFQKNDAAYQMLFSEAGTVYPTDSLFYTSFEIENQNFPLFTMGDAKYSVSQFLDFMKKNGGRSPFALSTDLLNDRLQEFEFSALREAKDKSLESAYPDFGNLIQEYRDGILMFDISNREVWGKASEDTVGLASFFDKNKQQYTWTEPHYKGYIVWIKDAKLKKKMQKEIAGMNTEKAVQYLYDNYKVGDVSYIKTEKGIFKKGDNPFVDEAAFKSGVTAKLPDDFQDFFLLGEMLNVPNSYTDVRGLVVTDYQNYLEDEWVKNLNKKYKVTVYPEVLNTMK